MMYAGDEYYDEAVTSRMLPEERRAKVTICPMRTECAVCETPIEDWQHKHCERCDDCRCAHCSVLGPDRNWYCSLDCALAPVCGRCGARHTSPLAYNGDYCPSCTAAMLADAAPRDDGYAYERLGEAWVQETADPDAEDLRWEMAQDAHRRQTGS